MTDCLEMTEEEYAEQDNECEMCDKKYATHTVRCGGMALLVCDEAVCQMKADNHCSTAMMNYEERV